MPAFNPRPPISREQRSRRDGYNKENPRHRHVRFERRRPRSNKTNHRPVRNHGLTALDRYRHMSTTLAVCDFPTSITQRDERRMSHSRQNIGNHHPTGLEARQDAVANIKTVNMSSVFNGFIDILHRREELPWGYIKVILYKVGSLVYYLANFVYSIVLIVTQRKSAFYFTYMAISFTGLFFTIILMTLNFYIKKYSTLSINNTEEETTLLDNANEGTHTNQLQENNNTVEHIQDNPRKIKRVLVDYVLLSLGEFLIYPTLVCTLYGFINERAWRFDNGISICNFIFFLYSVIMNALYMKFFVILQVIRVVRATHDKYFRSDFWDTEFKWKETFNPLHSTILLAILTAVTHWFMLGIVGVRIYVDNFTPDKDDTNSSIPNTGDYMVTRLTWYMIACTVYLPIVSWVIYIILNKSFFYKIYSTISGNANNDMPTYNSWDNSWDDSWNKTLPTNFIAYLVVIILILFILIAPFIAFTVGAYLPDYDCSDYEVAPSARNTIIRVLGPCFIISFLLANFCATMVCLTGLTTLLNAAVMLCTAVPECLCIAITRCLNDDLC